LVRTSERRLRPVFLTWRKNIDSPKKGGDLRGGRRLPDLSCWSGLQNATALHRGNPVRDRKGIVAVMGNEDCSGALHAQQVRCEGAECFAKFDVEVAEGFIQQEKPGLRREGPGESNTLSFPSGKLMRQSLLKAPKADLLKEFLNP